MKILFLFVLSAFTFTNHINAQVAKAMPPDADAFYNKSMPLLRPPVKNLILQTAENIKHHKLDSDSLNVALHKNPVLKGMSNVAVEGISVLIMVQASKDADDDLKKMVMAISRGSSQNNSAAKENEPANSKLQVIIDRKSGMAEEIGYVMKKISGNQQDIINNFR